MKGSLIIVSLFIAGVLMGVGGILPSFLQHSDLSVYILYLLMFQVGITIGCDDGLKRILRNIRPKLLLVPLATITGTLLFSGLTAFLLSGWSMKDGLAVGSGFAYYSLSSILITQLKEASLGTQVAAELGTIALLTNIMREIAALLGATVFRKYFGPLAPICVGGATTMDTTLPVITRYSGSEWVFVAIFHGIILEFSVPFLVAFFCK